MSPLVVRFAGKRKQEGFFAFLEEDLTESGKSPAGLRGAISSGWGVSCIISEINSFTMMAMSK